MDVAMLIIAIVSTLTALVSLIYTIYVKKEVNDIKKQMNVFIRANTSNKNTVTTNSGIVANAVEGGINFNGKKE